MKRKQQTIRRPAELDGCGLHTGEHVRLRVKPAEPNSGITFIRVDLPGQPRIPVCPENLMSKSRRSALHSGGAQVQTVEHLMSALAAIGIDNLTVELDGTEVPGADGSALPFHNLIREQADVVVQDAEVEPYVIREPVALSSHKNDWSIVAMPASEGLSLSYVLDYPESNSPLLASQYRTITLDEETWVNEIAPARTFCLASEVEALRHLGLGKGATYDNTVVVDGESVVNNTLRFPDEAVRHKLLDLIGDLYLLGRPLVGQILATKSGHNNNMDLVQAIAEQDANHRAENAADQVLDINRIQKILPHRYPMLLVDRILRIEGTERVVGLKNVTFNEPFFQGHWPERPVMPGVLLVESMAQVAGVLIHQHLAGKARYAMLISLDKVKLRRAVVPGDQVQLEAETIKVRKSIAQVRTKATVGGVVVAEAEIKVMLVDG